jgi:chemotaxis-related protein WspD
MPELPTNLPLFQDSQRAAFDACWRRIGVGGDGSCPELANHVHCRNCPTFAQAATQLFERPPGDLALQTGMAGLSSLEARRQIERERRARRSLLVFALGEESFGLDQQWVAEIAPVKPATRIAHRAGGLLEGLVNVRGELHLRISLERLLRIEAHVVGAKTSVRRGIARLVIVRRAQTQGGGIGAHAQACWTFAASHVQGVEHAAADDIEPPPAAMPEPWEGLVEGLVRLPSQREARVYLLRAQALIEAFDNAVYR